MLHLKQLLNPYSKPQEELTRIQAWISPEDKYLLTSVYPIKGVESYLLSGIYMAVCKDIRSANIQHFTPENATTVHEIIARHLAPTQPPGKGLVENDKGGVGKGGKQLSAPSHLSPDLGKGNSGRPRGGQRVGKQAKEVGGQGGTQD